MHVSSFCIFALQDKATGNKTGLWLRSKLQSDFFSLGNFVQRHPGKVLFFGVVLLVCLSLGLKSARMEWRVEKLWVEGKSESIEKARENGQLGNFHSVPKAAGGPSVYHEQLSQRRLFGQQERRAGRQVLFHH